MTTGSVLLGAALLIVVALVIARPFFQRTASTDAPRTARQQLLVQKDALLTQIQALDFDFETGKLPPEVYQLQRVERVAEAAVVLQQLDALPAAKTIDEEIEAAVAQLRGQMLVVQPLPAVGGNGHGRYCSQCGSPVDADDKFCARCGNRLTIPVVNPA